jgi:HK97 family phage portal protein
VIGSALLGVRNILADVGGIGGAPAPWDDYWYSPTGAPSVSGMRITPDTVKRLSTVIAAVSAKARALGVLPCLIYVDQPGGGKRVVPEHPNFKLLHDRPNDMQTAFEYYQMMQGHIELRGNAYSEILTGRRGQIGQLIPMHPDNVHVELMQDGTLRYQYNDPLLRRTRVLLQDEVFHVRDWADHRQVGQSRIQMGMDVFGVALAQQDYAGKFLKNDASAGVVITGTNFANKQDEDLYLKAFEESNTGERRHRAKLLPPGVDIKTLGVKPIDMQLLEANKASEVRICTLFNILPHLIGVDTGRSATYASVEQFNLMHAQQTVLPMAVMWEQALRRDLFSAEDPAYVKFSLAALLRGDFATRTTGYAVAIEHGWLSPDDVRELEDWNPIAGGIGKKYFVPMNWKTLDAAAAAPLAAPGDPDPESDQEDEDDDDDSGTGDSGTGDSGTGDPGTPRRGQLMRAQLELLAHDNASRCVRREVNGVRRLIERDAEYPELAAFYAEHFRFVCSVFHFPATQQLKVKQGCDARMSELGRAMGEEGRAAATVLIEQTAVMEPARLAALAVEGVL